MVNWPNAGSLPAVYAVAPIEGEPVVRWKTELYTYPYLGSPRALEGLLLCVAGGKDLVALDLQTGEPLWTYSHGENISGPAIAGGLAYFTHARNQLIALDIVTQKVRWQR